MFEWRGPSTRRPGLDEDVPGGHPTRTRPHPLRFLLELPVLLAIAAVVAVVVKSFLAQAFYIPSESMEPQLLVGDRVVVSRLAYEVHDPRRGDVLVFDDPLAPDDTDDSFLPVRVGREALEALGVVKPGTRELIKRVIALPGETVDGHDGHVYIDGVRLIEPYLDDSVRTSDFDPITVPDEHVWVMGDNRTNSQDSRVFGPVPTDLVVGRAIARVWPPGRAAFL